MKAVRHLLALVALALAAAAASAQFVKGNEAVKVMPDGTKKVETPPLPSATLAAPCAADNPACTASGWKRHRRPWPNWPTRRPTTSVTTWSGWRPCWWRPSSSAATGSC